MTRRVGATFLTAALLAGACTTDDGRGDPPPLVTAAPSETPVASSSSADSSATSTEADVVTAAASIEQLPCPDAIAGREVACAVATVPLDHDNPDSPTTQITLATMQGTDPDSTTPLVVLQGGPGGASSDLAAWFPPRPFPQIFIDQRGTGFAGVDFDCTEFDGVLSEVLRVGAQGDDELGQAALDACAARLATEPLLTNTSTESHAADVVAVMAGLGHQRWLLYGVSYGTTIGLEVLRGAPTALAGVILDGVYPPDIDVDAQLAESASSSLNAISSACAADAQCSGYSDDVVATVETLIERLNDQPLDVELSAAEAGLSESVVVRLDGARLAEFTFLLLYNESLLRYLPAVLGAIESGDSSAARWLTSIGSRTLVSSFGANDEATYFAVQCNDRLPFTDGPGDGLAPFPAAITAEPLVDACSPWRQRGADGQAGSVVRSDIPTLLLSGQFDPITPPSLAARVAEGLSNATLVAQDGRGHGIWIGNRCIGSIVDAFVDNPADPPDTSCADEGVAVNWAEP